MSAPRFINRYADIALFYSEDEFDQEVMDNGSGMFFLPGVQSFDFNFGSNLVNSKGSIGSKRKNFIYSNQAPDVSLNLSVLENFETLFEDVFTGGQLREDLNQGRNFYFIIGRDEERTVLSKYESSFSIGNCFLDSIKIKQSVGGILSSDYSYVGSNIIAQEYSGNDGEYLSSSGLAPSVNLTGDQQPVGNFLFTGIYNELIESNFMGEWTAGYNTYVKISGIGTEESFLIRPDNIQSFDIDLSFNRKRINSIDKFFPMGRVATPPFLGEISLENKFSDIEVSGSLLNFLKNSETYYISISGEKINGKTFMVNVSGASLKSKNVNNSISSNMSEKSTFMFGADDINILEGASVYLWNKNNGTIFSHNDFIWNSFV